MPLELTDAQRDDLLDELHRLLNYNQPSEALARLESMHPADQAHLIEDLDAEDREAILLAMSDERTASILEYLDEEPRQVFVDGLEPERLSQILFHVDEDLAADIVAELPDDQVASVLALLAPEDRETVEELLDLPEESAGRWMSPDVVLLQRTWTAEEAIDFLRREGPDASHPFYLYVVDTERRLQGVLSLRHLITAAPSTPLENLMARDVISVPVELDQEKAAEKLRHYNLMALPVVDEEGRLVGVLEADDVLDVQVEEATEDIYLQAGLSVDENPYTPVLVSLRRRVPWLLINLTFGFLSALIVSSFEGTISRVAALAAFMPIIAGHGGNTGSQTTTLIVRGIAVGEIERRDLFRILRKELAFGVSYGLVAGLLSSILAYILEGNFWLAVIVGVSMMGNIILAGMAGSLLPLGMQALKVDPALASTVWLTTITDWLGFVLLLGLGTLFMKQLGG
ncbi:magnesium transporter [bacterium CPR1]|nr:magnesium transporter [bacterium CPR1]